MGIYIYIYINVYMSIYKQNPLTQTNAHKFSCPFQVCFSENNMTPNIYIGHTTTTLSHHIRNDFSNIRALKQRNKA